MLPEKRLPMRHTREILRLHFESHLAPRQIAKICKVAKSTVQRYLERLKAAGLSWPLPADLDDVALERRLFPPPPVASPEQRCLPDCAAIHREMKSRKNVTLQLLWEKYKQANPLGYAYRWYCELYREWQRQLDVVLRHEHRAGEKTFVDYAGQTVPVTDPKTGEVRQAQVFVAVHQPAILRRHRRGSEGIGDSRKLLGAAPIEDGTDGTTMAERKSGKTLTPQPAGQ